MTRKTYRRELDALRRDVETMGDLVLEQLDRGLAALEHGDEALARAVIDRDETVNQLYLDLESDCIELFALQQPVASDLRFVAASFKLITDLERVGDLATNFGRYALAADRKRLSEVDIYGIGHDAHGMVEDALAAYLAEDAAACRDIAARDDDIDTRCQCASQRVVRDLIQSEVGGDGDGWTVERLLDDVSRVLLTIRDLERVADHAVNIVARTLYMAEGDPELIY